MLAGAAAGWVQDVHFGGPRAGPLRADQGAGRLRRWGWPARASSSPSPGARAAGAVAAVVLDALLCGGWPRRSTSRWAALTLRRLALRAGVNAAARRAALRAAWSAGCVARSGGHEDLRGPARPAAPPDAWSRRVIVALMVLLAGYFWHLQVLRGTLLPRAGREQPPAHGAHPRARAGRSSTATAGSWPRTAPPSTWCSPPSTATTSTSRWSSLRELLRHRRGARCRSAWPRRARASARWW